MAKQKVSLEDRYYPLFSCLKQQKLPFTVRYYYIISRYGVKVELITALSIKLVKYQFRFNFGLNLAKVYLIRPVRTLIDF